MKLPKELQTALDTGEPMMPGEVLALVMDLTKQPRRRYSLLPSFGEASAAVYGFVALLIGLCVPWSLYIVYDKPDSPEVIIMDQANDVERWLPGEHRRDQEECEHLPQVHAAVNRLVSVCKEKEWACVNLPCAPTAARMPRYRQG